MPLVSETVLTPQTPHASLKQPKPPEIEVKNPRYKGATPEMVGRVLLQRPPKAEKPVADTAKDMEMADSGWGIWKAAGWL